MLSSSRWAYENSWKTLPCISCLAMVQESAINLQEEKDEGQEEA